MEQKVKFKESTLYYYSFIVAGSAMGSLCLGEPQSESYLLLKQWIIMLR